MRFDHGLVTSVASCNKKGEANDLAVKWYQAGLVVGCSRRNDVDALAAFVEQNFAVNQSE